MENCAIEKVERYPATAKPFVSKSFSRTPHFRPNGSPLPLLVARIAANDKNRPLATNDFTLFANTLDAGSNLHGVRPEVWNDMMRNEPV